MAEASAFRFFEDPIARTSPSEVFIAANGQTFSGPNLIGVPVEIVQDMVDAIRDLAGQGLTDGVGETAKVIFRPDGTTWGTITAVITPGVAGGAPPAVTSIIVGATYSVAKALDLADGLELFL